MPDGLLDCCIHRKVECGSWLRWTLEPSWTKAGQTETRNSTTVVVAGYLAPADDWNLLEAQVLDLLKTRNAPYYHATDAEGKEPHGPYEGWSVEQAHELTDCIASTVGSLNNLKAVGAYIETVDWLDAVKLIESFRAGKNLFEAVPHDIGKSDVQLTMMNGRVTHREAI